MDLEITAADVIANAEEIAKTLNSPQHQNAERLALVLLSLWKITAEVYNKTKARHHLLYAALGDAEATLENAGMLRGRKRFEKSPYSQFTND